jgi:hypothetical protein
MTYMKAPRFEVNSVKEFVQVVIDHVKNIPPQGDPHQEKFDWLDPARNGPAATLEIVMADLDDVYVYRLNSNTRRTPLFEFLADALQHNLVVVGNTRVTGEKIDTENCMSPWRKNLFLYRRPLMKGKTK